MCEEEFAREEFGDEEYEEEFEYEDFFPDPPECCETPMDDAETDRPGCYAFHCSVCGQDRFFSAYTGTEIKLYEL